MQEKNNKKHILIVDDEPINIHGLVEILKKDYSISAETSGELALEFLNKNIPDLILLDVVMPGMDGFSFLKRIKTDQRYSDIPVIFITSLEKESDEEQGLRLGANDFITKPIKKIVVKARIENQLELKKARDYLKNKNEWLENEVDLRVHDNLILQEASLTALVGLAEVRDTDTGNHIIRTSYYCDEVLKHLPERIKNEYELDDNLIKVISKASQLHDIGKIGIPDSILLKPGSLTKDEFFIMKKHCLIGSNAISLSIKRAEQHIDGRVSKYHSSSLDFLQYAKIIAESHHEKWDGTGYPYGLSGVEIPLAARAMAIADVFDALTSKRVYKNAIGFDSAVSYIEEGSNVHFDPELVTAFFSSLEEFKYIFNNFQDETMS